MGSLMHHGTRLPLNSSAVLAGSQSRSDSSEKANSEQ
jgi:hypothetical protein